MTTSQLDFVISQVVIFLKGKIVGLTCVCFPSWIPFMQTPTSFEVVVQGCADIAEWHKDLFCQC